MKDVTFEIVGQWMRSIINVFQEFEIVAEREGSASHTGRQTTRYSLNKKGK